MPTDPRGTRRWQTESRRWLERTQPTHCALCLQPLDPHAPAKSSRSTSVDHIVPIADGCDPFDSRNWQAAHLGCNAGKRDRAQGRPPLVTSRDW